MEIQEGRVKLEHLLNTEQRIVDAYLPLIQELFLVAPSSDGTHDPNEYHGELKRFLEMFVAIFRLANILPIEPEQIEGNKDNENFLVNCMNKFRDVYRRHYRNVHYLSSSRIQEVRQLAESAAVGMIPAGNEVPPRLRELICQEGKWVERINTCKREKIIHSIRVDTISDFRSKIEAQFSLLYGDSKTDCYEEKWFESQHNKMLADIIADFKEQIPHGSTEDKFLIQEFTSGFETEVTEKITSNLIKRNVENIKNARSIMKLKVDLAVANYTKQMTSFVEAISLGQSTTLVDRHLEVKENCRPSFPDKIAKQTSGVLDLETEYINHYEKQVHASFQKMVEVGGDKAKCTLHQLNESGKTKLDNFIREYQEVFRVYGLPQRHIDQLRDRIEQAFVGVLEEVKDGSLADETSVDFVVRQSTPKQIISPAERKTRDEEIKESLERYKQEFTQRLENFIKQKGRGFEEVQRHHQTLMDDIKTEIKMNLIEQFGGEESWDIYLGDFHVFAVNYWKERRRRLHYQLLPTFGSFFD